MFLCVLFVFKQKWAECFVACRVCCKKDIGGSVFPPLFWCFDEGEGGISCLLWDRSFLDAGGGDYLSSV